VYVPNYIPDPIEVPGNVTEEPYRVRLGFMRRVSLLHFLSLLAIFGVSTLSLPTPPLERVVMGIGATLLVLSLTRIAVRATKWDQVISVVLFPILAMLLAVAARTVDGMGWPVWGILVGAGCAAGYAVSCGRDFSFVGQFFLSLVASSIILAIVATDLGMNTHQAAFFLGVNCLYLFFLVYDSASLLARRRLGEEAAAIVDLYRDVFNLFGYLVRVARHWRQHKIWAR